MRQRDEYRPARDDDFDPELEGLDPEYLIPQPPDGSWGWMIVFASFILNFLVDGITYCYGVWLVEFKEYFNESAAKTSMVGSLLAGCYLTAGPVVSALVNRFGCRPVTIFGSVMAGISFILSIFSPNVTVLILTYGVMAGISFGFMYLPAIVSVGYYFEEKRAFATGLAVCGSGIGTFVFAPFSKFLLTTYDWKGATLIVAGLVMNGMVCGALMRPLKAKKIKVTEKPLLQRMHEVKMERVRTFTIHDDNRATFLCNNTPGNELTEGELCKSSDSSRETEDSGYQSTVARERPAIPDIVISSDHELDSKSDVPDNYTEVRRMSTSATAIDKEALQLPQNKLLQRVKSEHTVHIRGSQLLRPNGYKPLAGKDIKEEYRRPMYRKDIFFSGSIMNLPEYKAAKSEMEYITSITAIPGVADEEGTVIDLSESGLMARCCEPEMRSVFKEMLDLSLLKDPVFLLICIANILAFIGFYIPFMYTNSRAIELGIPATDAAYLLSIIGITNTVSRVIVGWICDRPGVNALYVNNISLLISGVSTLFLPLYTSYLSLAVYCAVFGSSVAAFICLTSVILVNLMGLEKLTNAFGLLCLFRGATSMVGPPLAAAFICLTSIILVEAIGLLKLTNAFGLLCLCRGVSMMIGPPVAGMIYDLTQDFVTSYVVAGAVLTSAAVLLCLIPCFTCCKRPSKDENKCDEKEEEDRNVNQSENGNEVASYHESSL